MKDEKQTFSYTYSSVNRKEIESIREKYIKTEESDFYKLKRLDSKITNIANFVSICVGMVSSVLFALGLILCINFAKYFLGLIFSVIGFIFMGLTPLINKIVLLKLRQKYSEQIIELSDKLLNN